MPRKKPDGTQNIMLGFTIEPDKAERIRLLMLKLDGNKSNTLRWIIEIGLPIAEKRVFTASK